MFCVTKTAESKSYSSGVCVSGASGSTTSSNNSGTMAGHGGGNCHCEETNRRPRLPGPELDKRGRKKVGGRVKKQKKKNQKKCRKKSENKEKKKNSISLRLSSSKKNVKKVTSRKKKSVSRKIAKDAVEAAKTLISEQCEKKPKVIKIEQVADMPLLLAVLMQIKLHTILDNHIPVHWKQRKLSWGITCVIWLSYILAARDHRKLSVREYVKKLSVSLSIIAGQMIDELDFTDDRLGVLLKYLSKDSYWNSIEQNLSECSIEAYELQKEIVRCDATTVSGHHKVTNDGLFRHGVSKDNPDLPQIKIMTGALDPLGMPLATDIVSGEKADDILYIPVIKRINEYLNKNDIIYVGDCKISAFDTRLYIKGISKHYLCPIPNTGNAAKQMELWKKIGIMKGRANELNEVYMKKNDEEKLIAQGYEFERSLSGEVDEKSIEWTERLLIVNSPSYAKSQARGLEGRLAKATEKIYALTPQRGPGKRQITDEKILESTIAKILKRHKVEGMLCCKYEKEVELQKKYIGRGKGSANRPTQIIEKVRYQMLKVQRNEYRIKKEKKNYGWKVFVTDVSQKRLDFGDVVKCYRKEYRVERIFNRLKSHMNIDPLFVKRNDQIKGKTRLLTIGARIFTLIEYVVRRSLQNDQAKLKGLHPENFKKQTDMPTTERLLKVFSDINLTFIKIQGVVTRYITPLTNLQQEILKRLGIKCSVYTNLEIQKTPAALSEW